MIDRRPKSPEEVSAMGHEGFLRHWACIRCGVYYRNECFWCPKCHPSEPGS